jgi:transcription antitermination factor NusA-like protein
MTRFATMQSDAESVTGLASYLEERWLEAYLPAAEQWCAEMGALHIDEVIDEADAFAEALNLKPLEVKRLLGKPRSPREPQVVKTATPAPVDAHIERDSDATSTAPSTCTAQAPSDGFLTVSSKKSKSSRATSDAASTCFSEVSTAPTVKTAKTSLMKTSLVYVETTFTITARQVGALLGSKGATLSEIEAKTGAKVSVNGAKTDETRAVVIRGPSKKCVDRVAEMCKARIGLEFDAELARVNANETTETVAVDSSDIGALLGKGGANLRRIEATTKARIAVSKLDEDDAAAVRVRGLVRDVTVRGTPASVSAAKKAIADALRYGERAVEVPDWSVGELLGRGGKALERLQEKTGARVDIDKDAKDGKRLVRIRARTEDAANAAEEAVLQIVNPLEHSIEVTSTEAGVLIGHKGEKVKAIQKTSGARVTIDATGRMRTVLITGPTAENIQRALDAMRDALREELPAVRKTRTASPSRPPQGKEAPKMNEDDFPALR